MYVNTAKDGFKLEEAPDYTEQLADVQPTLLDLATKDVTIMVIGVKTLSCYFECSACGKRAETNGKLLKCDNCKLRQRITTENKQWYVKLFVQNITTKEKFYIAVFHQQLQKLFQANDKELHPALTDDEITDILLETDNVNVTYNLADGKLLQVN